jgi:putative ABC transport system permease protein
MTAPRLARWLTRLAAPADRRADMLGDLEEVHQRRRPAGPARAWLTTVLEAAALALVITGERIRSVLQIRDWYRAGDITQGLRLMRREPLVTITATVALAMGIGLLMVGVATVETLLFSRLPFAGGDRFVLISAREGPDRRPGALTPDESALLEARATTLAHLGAASQSRDNATLPSGVVDEVTTAGITPGLLPFLPYQPILGRRFNAADADPRAVPVIMIREAFWRRAFGGSADAIGATIDVGGLRRTIVGVMPNDFEFPNGPPELWMPMRQAFRDGRGALTPNERLIAVLAPDETLDSVRAQLSAIAAQISTSRQSNRVARFEVTTLTDLGPQAPIVVSMIIAAVAAILVVVAANVANLVLARSFLRARELAVRTALGASRVRLVSQISLEVLLLCSIAAIVGSAAAQATLRQFNAMEDLPFWVDFTAGPRTMLIVLAGTALATAIAGTWPAFRITRGDLLPTLQSSSERTGDVRFGRVAAVMVIVQIAVSTVMLHGALVLGEGLGRYAGEGLDLPANVLTTGVRFRATRSASSQSTQSSLAPEELEAALTTLPGVVAVGATTALPRQSPPAPLVEVEPLPGQSSSAPRAAPFADVSAGFFRSLDAGPVAGRLFTSADQAAGAGPVAVVNVPFVQSFLDGASPLGRRIRTLEGGRPGPWREIVGVVGDLGLSVGDPSLAPGYYVPLASRSDATRWLYLTIRVTGDPIAYVSSLRRVLYEYDPTLVLNQPQRLEDVASDDRAFFLWFSRALIGLGAVTLVLALTGVYSMMALVVTRRTREIGIRVALGATAQRVAAVVLGRAAWQVAVGGALGALLAVLSLDLRSVLVSRLGDGGAWTLPAVLILLVCSGLCAIGLPLRRALRVQPSEAMRIE